MTAAMMTLRMTVEIAKMTTMKKVSQNLFLSRCKKWEVVMTITMIAKLVKT